jgi:hypothetical protein
MLVATTAAMCGAAIFWGMRTRERMWPFAVLPAVDASNAIPDQRHNLVNSVAVEYV